ncbi:MAG TPA: CoA transferase [Candidatus Limnocylindria bacterium]|nr:CoA transferase [Candidatus Limnocylindria bacterium]
MTLPLEGIIVLDCSRVLAGPHATMLLADLGADVWKLEPPGGDETRAWGPPFWGDPADRRSAYFAAVNRDKRSLVVDLKTEAGHDVFDRLASRADLLVHNYLPSAATRLGMDPARLRERHPHLVVSVVRGFPGDGPLADRPAYDLVAQAWSGQMAVTGEPGGGPIKFGVGLLDLLAGLEAAIAALAALAARERGAAPAQVSVSLVEAAVAGLANVLGNHLATGAEPRRWGTGHPDIVPYQVFAARDGHVVVAVGNDPQFARLCRLLGVEPRPEWATNPERVVQRDEVLAALTGPIGTWARDDLVTALVAADIPGGPVHAVGEAIAAMEDIETDWVSTVDGVRLPASPIRVDGERLPISRPPPRLGEHTDEILRTVGVAPDDLKVLRRQNVIA